MSIHNLAVVHKHAYIGENVTIGPFAVIGEHAVIGNDCTIGSHVVIDGWTEIGEACTFHTGAVIGSPPQDLKYQGEETRLVIGKHNVFREYVTVNIGTVGGGGVTRLGDHCLMMAYSHVAHDCQIGNHVIFANCAALSGHIHVEDYAIIGGLSGIHQFSRIGAHCIIGGCSGVSQDIPPYMMATGSRAKVYGLNSLGLKRREFSEESIAALQKAYRLLFRSKLSVKHALEKIRTDVPDCPEVAHLIAFIESSERGICHGA
ncbi:acyl-ACP--UDP-N-acetylglucosamine O-acyltransferase [candidate division KSB3 bacterium]|uniref:Acyl-[acyl-carrier-protein]--UDP-N-acetylglucosamine O-acyltransferase n=1 Tax=candidate division KSB3 bacterium TaxID=2044937 RepID=A0A9D5JY06_9BACT|nr:acyl-ACP--UDP-N-acetylglucosamine O-acyltransferase [candidate division KSB3 bacterium]MBD3325912.1 acyl-ACP--UDP-N-acetylglucosamine O-acyltransferase [candidate division KSB3 bacterium]